MLLQETTRTIIKICTQIDEFKPIFANDQCGTAMEKLNVAVLFCSQQSCATTPFVV